MSVDMGLVEWAAEAVTPLGAPSFRRMMGGATLYCDGIAYAIVALDSLWFKADVASDAAWDAVEAERFTYPRKDGTVATMNYRRAPDACLDDDEAFREWAGLAIEAGRRAAAKKATRRR
ncbi:TfoX/Sxy family protein [Sphingomonas sp. 1P08PE]|uniref:TfoX/Sxy family protein n=1 Tax=Sphingomonas sp. 1P08PE TaxID=554122 RepID=UPI00399F3D53